MGAVHVARPQLARQTITLAIEQRQWMITRGLEVPVVGALLLLAVHRKLRAVHVQHHPLGGIEGFGFGNQLAIDRRQTDTVLFLRQLEALVTQVRPKPQTNGLRDHRSKS